MTHQLQYFESSIYRAQSPDPHDGSAAFIFWLMPQLWLKQSCIDSIGGQNPLISLPSSCSLNGIQIAGREEKICQVQQLHPTHILISSTRLSALLEKCQFQGWIFFSSSPSWDFQWLSESNNRIFRHIHCTHFKMAVSRDFLAFLFHKSNPSWLLINRLKWFLLKIRFREIFEFLLNIFLTRGLKSLHKMLVLVCVAHPLKARRGLQRKQKKNSLPAKLFLRGVWLCAVLACSESDYVQFGFSAIVI